MEKDFIILQKSYDIKYKNLKIDYEKVHFIIQRLTNLI